ncbi:MAG: DUF177 domain-containing protein [Bacteroidia bacterium]|jgi:uncharacterized metal-binding protein YceD (DUF177 family)|nr:DUF177 domain-containing protein [Bacteroidia bacterium]
MRQDKTFERQYSVNVARLRDGITEEVFEAGAAFFEYFPHAPIREGDVQVRLVIDKSARMLDVHFHVTGQVMLACDRCLQPYNQPVETVERVIYSFDPSLNLDDEEIIYVNPQEPQLSVLQECYDFIMLSVPMRKVPAPDLHTCSPEVLALIQNPGQDHEEDDDADESDEVSALFGSLTLPDLDEDDDEAVTEEFDDSAPVDPRWEALRKLKDQMEP